MALTYEILKGYDNFCSLQNAWNELLNKLPFYPPTATCCWLKAWIEANKETIKEIYVILIRDYSGNVVSIIPIYCHNSKIFFSA